MIKFSLLQVLKAPHGDLLSCIEMSKVFIFVHVCLVSWILRVSKI